MKHVLVEKPFLPTCYRKNDSKRKLNPNNAYLLGDTENTYDRYIMMPLRKMTKRWLNSVRNF